MCWLRIRNIDRDGRFSASGNIHHRTVVFMMAVRNSITKPFLKNNTWAYHHATSFLFFHLNSPRAGAFSSWWWKQKIIIINFFLNYWMYSSSDTTRASLPMQMPHPSLFLLLLLLFIKDAECHGLLNNFPESNSVLYLLVPHLVFIFFFFLSYIKREKRDSPLSQCFS